MKGGIFRFYDIFSGNRMQIDLFQSYYQILISYFSLPSLLIGLNGGSGYEIFASPATSVTFKGKSLRYLIHLKNYS